MKLSTLIIGLALLASALPSYAGGIMMMGGGVASTTSCQSSPFVGITASKFLDTTISGDANTYYRGGVVRTGTTKTVCTVSAYLTYGAGDISGKTYTLYIWTLDNNNRVTTVATSNGVTGSNSWSGTEVSFTLQSNVELDGATDYGIAITAGSSDGTNYATLDTTDDVIANWSNTRWDSSGNVTSNNGYDSKFRFYAYE